MSLAFGITFNHKVLIPNAADLKPPAIKTAAGKFFKILHSFKSSELF